MFDLSLLGRLKFAHATPTKPPLGPGRHHIGVSEERDYLLLVPESLDLAQPVKLMVLFHGAGGFPEKILKHFEAHAEREGFLILAPHSMLVTWDIVIGGSGPDIERLDKGLAFVADHFALDPTHLAFAGFSDGCSYALSLGITNGDIASHILAMSGGFMSVFMQEGTPRIFLSHGYQDEQLPFATAGEAKAAKLIEAGYDVRFVPFEGTHKLIPEIAQQAVDFFLDRGTPQSAA
jgi:phospholipase/carboxylesterase